MSEDEDKTSFFLGIVGIIALFMLLHTIDRAITGEDFSEPDRIEFLARGNR